MAINKVVYGNRSLIDLTADTVTPDQLAVGATAHDASGATIHGELDTYTTAEIDSKLSDVDDAIEKLTEEVADKASAASVPTKVSQIENDLDYIKNATTDPVALNGDLSINEKQFHFDNRMFKFGGMQIVPTKTGGFIIQTRDG